MTPAMARRFPTRAAGALGIALVVAHAASAQTPSAYATAVAIITRRQAADARVAVADARTILLTNGSSTARAIVLLHGLTDSPQQFAALAQRLHADGNNVFVPRFPHHGIRGGTASSLGALRMSELQAFADSVMDSAAGLGDSVVVVGLSLGGTVAAWIAQRRAIGRAVLIAPALEPGRVPSLLDRVVIAVVDRLPDLIWRSQPDAARPDREPGFSTRAVAELMELGRSVLRESARVAPRTGQLVLLLNANDRTVRESAGEALAREWTRHGATVSVLELPGSLGLPHNIIDARGGRVMDAAVLDLIRELAYAGAPSTLARRLPVR